ncbi:nucleoside triphosphate pyrophosphohydrolase [Demequina sp. NBRC 110057]|uniref:nucleoside triphosphate pyrophosphohydrolase n=1 Tax=Demequina sp. NBRC 110057 TaxID=1570346 RepID=UPI0013564380|nr:nucleoside triphosphate pyrophosphohydrolase [Demequina sp. NBRC 110057]
MGKLIRDGVPAAVQANGGHIVTRALSPAQFTEALQAQLVEEAHEAAVARTEEQLLEELGDLYELISTLARMRGFSLTDVERAADSKRSNYGGFSLRLESVEYVAGDGRPSGR